MERKQASTLFLVALLAIVLYLCFLITRPFLGPAFLAVMIAVVCRPVNTFIKNHVHNQNAAALISTLLVLVLLIAPTVLLGIAVRQEIAGFYQYLDKRSTEQGGWNPFVAHMTDPLVKWAGKYIDVSTLNLQSELIRWLKEISQPLLSFGAQALSNIFVFITNTVVTFFTLFYLFREGKSMREQFGAMLPLNSNQFERLVSGIDNSIIANVHGFIAVAVAQGALTGLAFWALGLPLPVLWGVVTGLFSMIPVVGSGAVWGPAVVILAINGHWWKAVALLVWGVVVIAQSDSFVRPYIISKRSAMHPLLVFFALLGGVAAFGFLGLFIGPVVLSITIVVFQMLKEANLGILKSSTPLLQKDA